MNECPILTVKIKMPYKTWKKQSSPLDNFDYRYVDEIKEIEIPADEYFKDKS